MISTLKADITGLDFDIIVNAANSRLLPDCMELFDLMAGHQASMSCITNSFFSAATYS